MSTYVSGCAPFLVCGIIYITYRKGDVTTTYSKFFFNALSGDVP